jgi:hypothetical protein
VKRTILFLLLVLCLFAVSASWASEAVLRLIERSSYSPEDKAYLQEQVASIFAGTQDAAQKLLLKKLREGLVKNVPPKDLIEALNRRKEALKKAQSLLEETGVFGGESILEDLVVSLELSVPPQILREVLARVGGNPKVAGRFVDAVATFLEVGVPPERTNEVLQRVLDRNLGAREIRTITRLLEQARKEGVEAKDIVRVLGEALERHENFALVEVELENFIAANKPQPALRAGQGVVAPQPGVSGGSPVEEGGTPLEPQPSAVRPPTQEGGTPLE